MNQKLATTSRRALLALCLALAAPFASAHEWLSTCGGSPRVWPTLTPSFEPATISFPGSFQTAMSSAFDDWSFETPGTRFRFNYAYTSDTTWAEGDGQSTVGFTDEYPWPPGVIGIALVRYATCFFGGTGWITESDVMFNSDEEEYFWSTTIQPFPPRAGETFLDLALINFKLTAMHELGHALGLGHESDVLATMNPIYPFGGVIGGTNDAHAHADDVRGDRAGYGTCCTERDVSASAYRRTSAGNSDHIFPPATSFRGHRTGYQFTIGNRGTTNEGSVRVQFYLSTDRTITTADTSLGAATYSLDNGVEVTNTVFVTVPTGLTPGNYFFGYRVDPLSTIVEVDEGNNSVAQTTTTNVPTNSPPIACFTLSPHFGFAPLTVSLDASCSSDPNGSIVSYHWDLGDGGVRSGKTASYTYFTAGSYTVTLTVTDSSGTPRSDFDFVNVNEDCFPQIECDEPF